MRGQYEYPPEGTMILLLTDNGYGIKMMLDTFRVCGRNTMGMKALDLTDYNGHVIAVQKIKPGDLIAVVTKYGILNIIKEKDFPLSRRKRRGVKAIRLKGADEVTDMFIV